MGQVVRQISSLERLAQCTTVSRVRELFLKFITDIHTGGKRWNMIIIQTLEWPPTLSYLETYRENGEKAMMEQETINLRSTYKEHIPRSDSTRHTKLF